MDARSSSRAEQKSYWRFSPALNLCEEYSTHIKTNNIKINELNILLFGNTDSRHILKTISKLFEYPININFYAVDDEMETVARNMLLILIAFENKHCLSLENKTHLFMDVYGNTFLKPSSSQYVAAKSQVILKMLKDSIYMENMVPIFDINLIKYSDLDRLEDIFKFWSFNGYNNYDIKSCWDIRVRCDLGGEYDTRLQIYDWDYCMKFASSNKYLTLEHVYWRNTGIAFTFPEYEQTEPNRTLCDSIQNIGLRYKIEGYNGDTICGPYYTYGMDLMSVTSLKARRKFYDRRSTDITKTNIYQMMYEIQEKQQYNSNDKIRNGSNEPSKYDKKIIDILAPKIKINFITTDAIINNSGSIRNEWKSKFDLIFVANHYFSKICENFFSLCRDHRKSMIIFETKLYATSCKSTSKDFFDKIQKFAKDNNLKNVLNFDCNVGYSLARYQHELNIDNLQ